MSALQVTPVDMGGNTILHVAVQRGKYDVIVRVGVYVCAFAYVCVRACVCACVCGAYVCVWGGGGEGRLSIMH